MSQNYTAVKHLAWRAGFGLAPEEWSDPPDLDGVYNQLFNEGAERNALPDFSGKRAAMRDARRMHAENFRELRAKWIQLMAGPTGSVLREKLTLFWHGHFACQSLFPGPAAKQLKALRTHALGNFRNLLLAISKDAAMIRYLNNQQNRKDHPNENYARELMELFTIGRGRYTERDVQEAARAFTGWSSDLGGNFVLRARHHDFGEKTFMGRTGNWDGADIIDILLAREETAMFIAGKLYRYFVNPREDPGHIRQLGRFLYSNDYDIGATMQYLFRQAWFFDPENIGVRIKSPVELIAGMIRIADISNVKAETLHHIMRRLGQVIYSPPSVAGWPGGRQWINSSTLPLRLNLPLIILAERTLPGDEKHVWQGHFYYNRAKLKRQCAAFNKSELTAHVLTGSQAEKDYRVGRIRKATVRDLATMMGSPEYQMC